MPKILKRYSVFCLLFILYSKKISAQDYNISIHFEKAPQKVYISGLYVDQFKLIDSVEVKNKVANINIDTKSMPVNYQILSKKPRTASDYKKNICFYLYFENENIEIFSPDEMVNNNTAVVKKGDRLKDYIAVEKASQKYQVEMYMAFKQINNDNANGVEPKLELLNANLDRQHKEFMKKYKTISARNSSTFVNITNLLIPMHFHLKKDKNENRLSAIKTFETLYHFNEEALLFTPLLKEKVNEYFEFFQTRFLTYAESSRELIKAIDVLVDMSKENSSVQFAVMKQFLFYIRRFSFDEVIIAFDEKYLKKISNIKDSQYINYIVKPYRLVAKGKKGENIATKDMAGKPFDLYKVNSKYTALLFFSSTCSHCRKELPLIKKWYANVDNSKLQFVTISIDANEQQWRDFLVEGSYPFTHICDFKSWNSPFVKSYNIHGTPSIIILDQDKTILKKIVQIEDLKTFFKDIL